MSENVVCEEVVCERWCVTMVRVEKFCVCVCVEDGVWQTWCVTKMCAKDGV